MKINIIPYSSSFAKRTVCKYCKTGPTDIYSSYESFCDKDYNQLKDLIIKYYDSFNPEQSEIIDPRLDFNMNNYSFSLPFSFNIRLHKNLKLEGNIKKTYEKIDLACCYCSRTIWFYNSSYAEKIKKVDVVCRKSNKKYKVDF